MHHVRHVIAAAVVLSSLAGCDQGGGAPAQAPAVVTTAPVTVTAPVKASNGRPLIESRRIDVGLSLRKGELGRTLYVVRDESGRVGALGVGCAEDGRATSTRYAAPAMGTDVAVAVDGRGVSRAEHIRPGDA